MRLLIHKTPPITLLTLIVSFSNLTPQEDLNKRFTHRNEYSFIYHFHTGIDMDVGYTNINSLYNLFTRLEEKYLSNIELLKPGSTLSPLAIFLRMSKLFLIDHHIAHAKAVFFHEYFGHTSRIRAKGGETKIKIYYQFPLFRGYAIGSGGIRSLDYDILFASGGVEANSFYGNKLRKQFLFEGYATHYDLLSYVYHFHDISGYILFGESGDPRTYLLRINSKYRNTSHLLSIGALRRQALFNLLDPFLFLTAYEVLFKYFPKGNIFNNIPMIDLGTVDFVPLSHFALTPFGYERYFELFFRKQATLLYFYGRLGDDTFANFWGLGFEGLNLIQFRSIKFNFKFDIWRRPSIITKGFAPTADSQYGLNGSIESKFAIGSIVPNYINGILQIGYKTKGYVIGMELTKSFYLRSGFLLRI